ncbi:hypothetical protein BRC98_05535 [Halobacteriales archaeon QS_7_68_65]|nr:MAG: hypothetical protein BRC98_05535 [Halobacteriales archaeon QS_7_68_65]
MDAVALAARAEPSSVRIGPSCAFETGRPSRRWLRSMRLVLQDPSDRRVAVDPPLDQSWFEAMDSVWVAHVVR